MIARAMWNGLGISILAATFNLRGWQAFGFIVGAAILAAAFSKD